MSSSLILLSEVNATSGATANITFTDTSFDVYFLQFNDVRCDTDDKDLNFRFTASGTADSSANYEYAVYELRADTSHVNRGATGQTSLPVNISGQGTGTGESCNGNIYAFNFNNTGEFSHITMEITMFDFVERIFGWQGGGALKAVGARNGFEFFWESSANFSSGNFKLYGLVK
jgi:hypothetical protein